jgi:hypothetical protein
MPANDDREKMPDAKGRQDQVLGVVDPNRSQRKA